MFNHQPDLTGDLLSLRPARWEDFDALLAVASDPLIWAMHPARDRLEDTTSRPFLDDAVSDRGVLVAVERETGSVVGFSRYSERHVAQGEVEIGWTFWRGAAGAGGSTPK